MSESGESQRRNVNSSMFRWTYFAVFLLLAIAVTYLGDVQATLAVQNWAESERAFLALLKPFGDALWSLLAGLILFAVGLLTLIFCRSYWGRWHAKASLSIGWYIFASIAGTGLAVQALKRLIGRARPSTPEEIDAFLFQPFSMSWQWHAFPSGHTTTAFTTAVVLTALTGRKWAWLWFPIAGMVGISRVTAGAHFVSDIIAGALLGTVLGLVIQKAFIKYDGLFRDENGHTRCRLCKLLRRAVYGVFSRA